MACSGRFEFTCHRWRNNQWPICNITIIQSSFSKFSLLVFKRFEFIMEAEWKWNIWLINETTNEMTSLCLFTDRMRNFLPSSYCLWTLHFAAWSLLGLCKYYSCRQFFNEVSGWRQSFLFVSLSNKGWNWKKEHFLKANAPRTWSWRSYQSKLLRFNI